jgi:hypothetical protein
MTLFAAFGYSGKKLACLSECRMWLKAITVANITTADGRTITLNSWNGTGDQHQCNNFLWPRLQTKLGYNHWIIWRSALSECLLMGTSVNDHHLRLLLGTWTKQVSSAWPWYYSPSNCNLYCYENQTWVEYRPNTNQRLIRHNKVFKAISVHLLPCYTLPPASYKRIVSIFSTTLHPFLL